MKFSKFALVLGIAATVFVSACKKTESDPPVTPNTPTFTVKDGKVAHYSRGFTVTNGVEAFANDSTRWDVDTTAGSLGATYNSASRLITINAFKGRANDPNSQLLNLEFAAQNGSSNFIQNDTADVGGFAYFGKSSTFNLVSSGTVVYDIRGTITVSNLDAAAKTFDLAYNFKQTVPGANVRVSKGTGKKIKYN
jgi:hypothetical protein